MAIKAKNLVPAMATHPGEFLKGELESRKISQTDFANDNAIAITHLNEIIKGKRNITADFALILENALNISAIFWMNLQTSYELDESRIKVKTRDKLALIGRWNTIKQYVPVTFFKKQRVLTDSLEQNEIIIKKIYDAENIDEIIHAASKPCYQHFRKSEAFTESMINIVGWVKYVEYLSREIAVDDFKINEKDNLIQEFKSISTKINLIDNTEKLLKKYGIKFIVQSKPDKAPIDGVAFWKENNPTIALTLRYHRIDNFIFNIMHELGHVYKHLLKNKTREFVDDLQNFTYMNGNADEIEANSFATDNLISKDDWEKFQLEHFEIDDDAILDFANELKIHPAIVRGRLCHEQHSYYRKRTSIPNVLN